MKKKLKSLIYLTLLSLLFLFALTGCGKATVDLQQYASISFSGANGYGTATLNYNEDGLYAQLLADSKDLTLVDITDAFLTVGEDFYISIEPREGLSNGDNVTVTLNYPDTMGEILDVNLTPKSGTSWTATVEGLYELGTIDLFSDIESRVSVDGMAPDGRLMLFSSNTYSGINYVADKTEGLSNGDVVTITASAPEGYDLNDFCAVNYNAYPETAIYEYTVTGLDSGITSKEAVPSDIMEQLYQIAENAIEESWKEYATITPCTLNSQEYVGYFMLNLKECEYSGYGTTQLFLIYRVNATNEDTTQDLYTYVRFEDLYIQGNGSLTDLPYYDAPVMVWAYGDPGSFPTGISGFIGYQTLDDFASQVISPQEDKYTVETDLQ